MAIKKSELYSMLWKSCDELRGGMDASQYKDYVLVLLFIKYVSDKAKSDYEFLIEVPENASFKYLISLKGNTHIGDEINKAIGRLAEANDLKGVIDQADFADESKLGSGKDMQNRLSNLIAIFEDPALDFSKNRAEGDDLLGDAYEYLMRHFATESGKSKGQFYTPSEVSRIMAKVIEIEKAESQDKTVYDPTCGSGSLLLKTASETKHGITIYGQENDVATRGLAKMNMILHNNPTAVIYQGNTLADPKFRAQTGGLKLFDYIVANPPFSNKNWSNGIDAENDEYERFEGFGIPPKKNGDYAFLLHVIRSLNSTGKGCIVLPHGVLFRGNAEGEIRKNLIKRGYIKGIIGLPANLFYGTGIPACLIIINKEGAESRKGIFMLDASKGYYKDGNKNRLRSRDIHKIVDVFRNQIELDKYSRLVPNEEISNEKNNFNLNIPRYIDSQEDEDLQDIHAHLNGRIPAKDILELKEYWQVCPNLRKYLFKEKSSQYYDAIVFKEDVKNAIFEHAEFKEFFERTKKVFYEWIQKNVELLESISSETKPKDLIYTISEDLLKTFSGLELIDKYEMYQHIMTYWAEIMQDDVYMLVFSGWKAEIRPILGSKGKQKGWTCDLLPKELVISKCLSSEQEEVDVLSNKIDEINQEKESLEEENSGEEDLFEDARSDAGSITKGDLKKRIKEIKSDSEYKEEFEVLTKYYNLIEEEASLKKKLKEKAVELDKKLFAKYKELTESEVKELVVHDKWLQTLEKSVEQEIERIAQKLARRIKELIERYETPLPLIEEETNQLQSKVEEHLKTMGFKW